MTVVSSSPVTEVNFGYVNPTGLVPVVNEVERLAMLSDSAPKTVRLAPIAAGGGDRGKAENCNLACESSFSTSFTTEQARMGSKSNCRTGKC